MAVDARTTVRGATLRGRRRRRRDRLRRRRGRLPRWVVRRGPMAAAAAGVVGAVAAAAVAVAVAARGYSSTATPSIALIGAWRRVTAP